MLSNFVIFVGFGCGLNLIFDFGLEAALEAAFHCCKWYAALLFESFMVW